MKATTRGEVLEKAAACGWTPDKENKKGYLRLRCGCGKHLKWVHKTPSGSNYWTNCISEIVRTCCTETGVTSGDEASSR